MSLVAVIRQDLLDVRRSKLIWVVLITCLLIPAGGFYGITVTTPVENRTMLFSVAGIVLPAIIFLPVIALVSSSSAIARERESGTIRFLLGFPNDRREVVLGKFLSRAALINVGLSIGFAVTALLAVVFFDQPGFLTLATFALLTMLFATAYVGLAIGISAVTSSQMRAIAGVLASAFVWAFIWIPFVPSSIPSLVEKHTGVTDSTLVLVDIVSPSMAYAQTLQLLGPDAEPLVKSTASAPLLVSPTIAIGSLVAWVVVPLALGYWWFCTVDIT